LGDFSVDVAFGSPSSGCIWVEFADIELGWGFFMNKSVAALAAFILSVSAQQALSADLPVKALPPVQVASPTWSGWYVGVEGGGDWGQFTQTNTVTNVSLGTFNQTGALVGGTIGYNWQFGALVYGLETDLSWTDLSGTQACGPTRTNICTTDLRAIGTARGRIGTAAVPNLLIYATGGLAYADIHATRDTGATSSDDWRATWTIGAGAEYMVFSRLSLKAEYLYAGFNGVATTYIVTAGATPVPVAAAERGVHIVRGGLNWHF
jgi:outer membrane immunogenic protein